ncbi:MULTISPECIES: hypothetical protein [Streptomyces]|uniref:hypothetical protein n=1 Tax=Streptomyces TaxID=1883 RepID=UPI00114D1A4A|nr:MULTISPECIES: hypothetical protein [Streptomyces]
MTITVLPLVGALSLWSIQGGWGWILEKISDPPGLEVYSKGPMGCVPEYVDSSLSDLKRDPEGASGVPVSAAGSEPVEMPITLQAKTSQAIVVSGLEVRVLSRVEVPVNGSIIEPDGCGGLMSERRFDVNLKSLPASIEPHVDRRKGGSGDDVVDFPFKITSNDPEQVLLLLDPIDEDIRFSVKVEWVSGGEYGSVTLDNDGRGYRVIGPGNLPSYPKAELYRRG